MGKRLGAYLWMAILIAVTAQKIRVVLIYALIVTVNWKGSRRHGCLKFELSLYFVKIKLLFD